MERSNSYIAFKTRTQEIFEFAVLVTSSVPVLKYNLTLLEKGVIKRIPEPDYFEPSVVYVITEAALLEVKVKGLEQSKITNLGDIINKPMNNREFKEAIIERIGESDYKNHRNIFKSQSSAYSDNLNKCAANYQTKLASYLYFSLFSYFEAFIGDLSYEVIDNFNKIDIEKYLSSFKDADVKRETKVLDTTYDPRKVDKYKKYSKELLKNGYVEPELILFSSMLTRMQSSVKNLKANDIPIYLKEFFYFELEKADNETYHSIRNHRNFLGHGVRSFTPVLKNVIDANKFFKRISCDIDNHITKNFMRLNNFRFY